MDIDSLCGDHLFLLLDHPALVAAKGRWRIERRDRDSGKLFMVVVANYKVEYGIALKIRPSSKNTPKNNTFIEDMCLIITVYLGIYGIRR